jgi:hypothetical protein
MRINVLQKAYGDKKLQKAYHEVSGHPSLSLLPAAY